MNGGTDHHKGHEEHEDTATANSPAPTCFFVQQLYAERWLRGTEGQVIPEEINTVHRFTSRPGW
ncbi:MAG: hypothetical protein ACLFWL_08410 [Candidatus Brocadiia bacterium]